jgi:hypothetical protein
MLARISHQLSTAAADPGMSPALRSVGLLDILSSMSAGPSVALAGKLPDAPCIHNRLRRLATKAGEKCGQGIDFPGKTGYLNRMGRFASGNACCR